MVGLGKKRKIELRPGLAKGILIAVTLEALAVGVALLGIYFGGVVRIAGDIIQHVRVP